MPLPQLFWRPRVMFSWTSSGSLRVNSMRHSPVIGPRVWPLVTAAGATQKTNRMTARADFVSIGRISSASFQVSATARQKVSEKMENAYFACLSVFRTWRETGPLESSGHAKTLRRKASQRQNRAPYYRDDLPLETRRLAGTARLTRPTRTSAPASGGGSVKW